jgi:hypothetical protein
MRKKISTIKNDTKRQTVRTSVLLSQKDWLALKKIQLAKHIGVRDIIVEFIKKNKTTR